MSETIRSFIAAEISEQQITRRISEIQDLIVATGAYLRAVQPQNVHVTIRFLGEIPAPVVEEVKREMNEIVFNEFQTIMRGVGAFPNLRRPNVVWIGMSEGASELRQIHAQIEPRVRSIGLPSDNKGFNPHITIARVRSGRNTQELSRAISEMETAEVGTMKVSKIALKRSVLTPRGPIYSTLFEKHAVSKP